MEQARTAARQRDFVRERLGGEVECDKEKAREIASAAIYEAVQTKDNPADLINVALERLVKERLELPGYTTLNALASAIRTKVNTGFFQTIACRIDEADTAGILGMLQVAVTRMRVPSRPRRGS